MPGLPDLLIDAKPDSTDGLLIVKDGLQTVRELREWERTDPTFMGKHLPVCGVTGNATNVQKDECLSAGFDHCLVSWSVSDNKLLADVALFLFLSTDETLYYNGHHYMD